MKEIEERSVEFLKKQYLENEYDRIVFEKIKADCTKSFCDGYEMGLRFSLIRMNISVEELEQLSYYAKLAHKFRREIGIGD